ncbi:DUF6985 domain-containing protein [Streptomyces sp. NPDC127197]|uniref:DUF6985 domain-containing protein n=1 Tax=Streptomyces sp. NPDC127197 TaxID=3345388 RepID=UPI00363256BF
MDRTVFFRDDAAWTTRVPLPAETWTAATGNPVPVHYAPEGREDHPLDDAEIASVARAVDHLPDLFAALRPALLTHHHTLRAPATEQLTDATMAGDLEAHLHVVAVYVHQMTRDGIPYVGIEFCCPCDEEHGVGVLMHGTRTVDVGGADTAFLLWIAERDATDPRTGLDESLIGHWHSSPFDWGAMETSAFELRADGRGWSCLTTPAGESVTRLTWRCPDPGVLELRTEDGEVTRHRYVITPAVPAVAEEPVPAVTFEEPVEFAFQYAKSG